ncbi:LysR family transcriptional regulator [Nakamurella flavida]|uniref:LysR family transcriptional regulator n=1 Tax=Nakamurella flavida TaxID=363630 RepID=A0A939C2C3_9ACTN|nr:LysR family transcriptional regulator [Nakamurella flavida]MBM9476415.1 LysR family transcriptional regulator [Nakamurella flavida]MDP9779484.1 DNA-binding transcriptional LysR family regulator [Nakamurella flavida]
MLSSRVPDLVALQLLLAVQSTGSLGAAGVRLGMTQQAASLRMRSMEAQVGVPLLARSRRGSTLTEAGGLLAQWAGPVIGAAAELDAGVESLRTDRDAHLRVAASLTVAEHLIPRWLVRLRDEQRAAGGSPTEVRLVAANSDAVAGQVAAGQADLGFVETPRAPDGLPSRVVAGDDLVVVVPPTHPWARRRGAITAALLARTALVSREPGSGTRDALAGALHVALPDVVPAPPALEVSSSTAMRAAITAGTAPGVLSALAVADDLALGRLRRVPVAGLDLHRELRAVWRSGPHPPAGPARELVALAARRG